MPDFTTTPTMRMILLEPEVLLRRTVAMTARSLGMAEIHEAASVKLAQRMMQERVFHGAVIALDDGAQLQDYDLSLLDEVRKGHTASPADMPIAVMAGRCDAALVQALRQRQVNRVILKPFRARLLLEVFTEFSSRRH